MKKIARTFPLKHKFLYLVIACAVMGLRLHAHAEDVAPNPAAAQAPVVVAPVVAALPAAATAAPVTAPEPAKTTEAPANNATPPTTQVASPVSPGVAPVTGDAKAPEPKAENSANVPATSNTPATAGAAEEGEYEIDYEEEPADTDEMESAEPVKVTRGKKTTASTTGSAPNPNGGSGGIQGSRAKHRFTPILKSETKSIYQKDGKALDVDTD